MFEALRPGVSRGAALKALRTGFAEAGVDSFAADARLLLCAAEGVGGADLIREPDIALSRSGAERLAPMARRRAAREPVSRILARREFWGLPLTISSDVLDPRADTETLVEAAVRELATRRNEPLRILDLGTGSGAILCALLKEFPGATGVAIDISPAAAALARANLAATGVARRALVMVGAWGAAVAGSFDVIVSNPPYVRSLDIAGLEREVSDHDPKLALDGGPDGLDAYRAIGRQIRPALAQGGRFFLEIGAGQAGDVTAILAANGLTGLSVVADLAGVARVVKGGLALGAPSLENKPLGVERKKD